MTPILLRQFWSFVEQTHPPFLLGQDDASLVEWLLAQFNQQRSLGARENECLGEYIRSKTALIRDLAEQR